MRLVLAPDFGKRCVFLQLVAGLKWVCNGLEITGSESGRYMVSKVLIGVFLAKAIKFGHRSAREGRCRDKPGIAGTGRDGRET
jgi:hypothetical protein